MVEMNMPDASLLSDWHAWYDAHIRILLSVPGFASAQRFQSMHATDSPYVAIYGIASAAVITSAAYREAGGPQSAGTWRLRMTHWKRNLLEGLDAAPRVAPDGWLAILDRRTQDAPPLPAEMSTLRPVGLDCSMVERGLLAGSGGAPPKPRHEATWQLRAFRPLTDLLGQRGDAR